MPTGLHGQPRLAECDKELSAYRAELNEGADAAIVTKWIAETQARRLAAQRTLTLQTSRPLRQP